MKEENIICYQMYLSYQFTMSKFVRGSAPSHITCQAWQFDEMAHHYESQFQKFQNQARLEAIAQWPKTTP